ncbi:RNA 3'-terminal phosphate cyclase [Halodesulfurarchaeum sp.]|uniref:RNA 3'-terminal phosphate cyclase n=1 Tax=Halodesulfurarchaeum sp. TaxID=1980530 RepID=UPI001BBA74DC|nr:RNA 3'-terminal phosphate cyclase [Halodesulfurarchaeum sp.]
MKQIDGATGGGQVLRLGVALAALEDSPIKIQNVRGERDTPGLRAQHVGAVESVAALSNAESDGVSVGSETVTFEPGEELGGNLAIDMKTAGSISLLFDAVLPLAIRTTETISVQVTGGTDVKWSPPIDYLRHVKLPVLRQFGLAVTLESVERGFFPTGGGSATLTIKPSEIGPINCAERGALEDIEIYSVASADLADADVATRQVDGVTKTLEKTVDVPISEETSVVKTRSTGTTILLVAKFEHSRAGFSALGEPGWPAEEVGESAADSFLAFQSSPAAIESHLADQLLPFLALQGGEVTSPRMTEHIESCLSLLNEFDYSVEVTYEPDRVRLSSARRT